MKKVIVLTLTILASYMMQAQHVYAHPELVYEGNSYKLFSYEGFWGESDNEEQPTEVEDSTYTTTKTESISGFQGISDCSHEWFSSSNEVTDTVGSGIIHFEYIQMIVINSVSLQCIVCGKQISTVTTHTTRLKNDEDEE